MNKLQAATCKCPTECCDHNSASKPTKEDCRMLEAIMKAAAQIHDEFDCLSDHVMTKRQIREQIAAIIWQHLEKVRLNYVP